MTSPDESWIEPIFDSMQDVFLQSGYFERVNLYEPKRAPSIEGLSVAIWLQTLRPYARVSGLALTSALAVFTARIYKNMLEEPQEEIDPKIMRATSNVLRSFNEDFDLDGLIHSVDLLGMSGTQLGMQMGYLDQDGKKFRVSVITIPCIINDVWTQAA